MCQTWSQTTAYELMDFIMKALLMTEESSTKDYHKIVTVKDYHKIVIFCLSSGLSQNRHSNYVAMGLESYMKFADSSNHIEGKENESSDKQKREQEEVILSLSMILYRL